MTFAFFYRASLGGPDERREQKFATLVGDHFGMSPTNILLTPYPSTSKHVFGVLINVTHKPSNDVINIHLVIVKHIRNDRVFELFTHAFDGIQLWGVRRQQDKVKLNLPLVARNLWPF
jgi:hypothetical protein